ncbi:Cysteine--tRNA ligase, cytoplasmic [Hypsibius exemplaris]|uniref:Cysteine--tRNA ligase, cytoplasmic n=1 Tax=Hypsibius exemplaris TaxID=2072580 RepID=A0A1W0WBT0_HYPEX|nr:Cysteine--tRNA ligase, cytoplasmic [Hypsibius exemplaris]
MLSSFGSPAGGRIEPQYEGPYRNSSSTKRPALQKRNSEQLPGNHASAKLQQDMASPAVPIPITRTTSKDSESRSISTDIDRKKLTYSKSSPNSHCSETVVKQNGHHHHHPAHPSLEETYKHLVALAMDGGDFAKVGTDEGADRSKLVQGLWRPPKQPEDEGLKLFNSFTRKKEPFRPQSGKRVLWYTCGPTVYDASHMGHARAYISFDILRRVMTDYFNYDVSYVMNITDIDDKIIKRARVHHLIESYAAAGHTREKVIADAEAALKKFNAEKIANESCSLKRGAMDDIFGKCKAALEDYKKAAAATPSTEFCKTFSEPLGNFLDDQFGHTIVDNAIFNKLPRFWEEDYHKDMAALHVQPADILTRVSEYVPEITDFIKKIIDNGYAYEAEGSVYFDTVKFDHSEDHHYAKLVPEAFGDLEALTEGEGVLSEQAHGKRQAMDFALWKTSKPGEPAWDSPWGRGRPGWHIECSVMATAVLGDKLDIHAGGVDLRFPHHDNEIAQSEAYFQCDSWVNYFLHSGHLTISGCKMSKSLKNFITIKEALTQYTARQIRLMFLLHSWRSTLDYSPDVMDIAIKFEKTLKEFFLTVKDLIRSAGNSHPKWTADDLSLRDKYFASKQKIHEALCDSVDTRTAMDNIRDIIGSTNVYIQERAAAKAQAHPALLQHISLYLTRMMRVFGVIDSDESIGFTVGDKSGNVEETILPYVSALADFRELVRKEAREVKAANILQFCDRIRDDVLPNLGVRLEDREGQPPAVKLVDKNELMKEREAKLQAEEEKRVEKERKKREIEEARLAKERQMRVPPSELFRSQTDKFSLFDDKGMPTHDHEGKEISKGQLKKLEKLYQTHEAKFKELAAQNGNALPNGNAS